MTETTPKRRGSGGSFWISQEAIKVLLANHATATEIAAYLILARFTDESGQFSTAGRQAVYTNIGIGQKQADQALQRLCQMFQFQKVAKGKKTKTKNALVLPADVWEAENDGLLPHGPSDASKVRWVLNHYGALGEARTWMSNELVDGFGSFRKPMQKLKRSGDLAARILLLGYQWQDLERFGGISPTLFFSTYDMKQAYKNLQGGYDLWHGEFENQKFYNNCGFPTLGINQWPTDPEKKQELVSLWFKGMSALDSAGFIYEVVSVLDRKQNHAEAQVVYELNARTRHGYKPKGEGGLGGLTAKLAGLLGKPVADASGRFYGKYAAIVPAGMETHIIGIWRLRFRVSNPKNYGVIGAWARIHRSQAEALDWIKDLAEQYGYAENMGFTPTGELSDDE